MKAIDELMNKPPTTRQQELMATEPPLTADEYDEIIAIHRKYRLYIDAGGRVKKETRMATDDPIVVEALGQWKAQAAKAKASANVPVGFKRRI
jgi:hypothetical protein